MPNNSNPLVSFVLFAYNQESIVAETIESLLSQTYSSLEIILSDDASTDNTFKIMQDLADKYHGPHRIKLNGRAVNSGIGAHFNDALSLAEGELIFWSDGDDISLPDRCSKVVATWLEHNRKPEVIAADAFDMAFNGEMLGVKTIDNLESWRSIDDWFVKPPYFFGASFAFTPNMIRHFGKLHPKIQECDQIIMFRAILTGNAIRLPEPLVKYRRGGISQQAKTESAIQKQKKIVMGSINSINSIRQHTEDARVVGKEKTVEAGFKNRLELDQLIFCLAQSNSRLEKVKVALCAKNISITKRIRFLTYAAFPEVMVPYFFIKKISRVD